MTQKTDAAILNRVDEALWKDDVLRLDYNEIHVSVRNQIVALSGYVVSASNQQRVLRAVEPIPGILGIKNSLFLDDSLTRTVAMALSQLEKNGQVRFFTGVRHGVVTLNGDVPDIPMHTRAEKCAAGIPGVRGVLNHIRIQGLTQNQDELRFLQPAIDSQIFFSNGPSGTVEQVIIDPNTLLVVAMMVVGPFSRLPEPSGFLSVETLRESRKVIIPVREIRHLTQRSGFLHIRSVDTARYTDFTPKAFVSPEKGWQPPHPYRPEDVLFPRKLGEAAAPTGDAPDFVSVELPAESLIPRE